ncbi:MAG: response regulator, partial [Acidobacteriota bacterium]
MRRRILLADDSVTIQKVIELTFMDEDYDVKAVSNGDEALAALPDVKPDVVIADVHMPAANGYEVCRRSKEIQPDVPVLLLVGTFEPFDEGQARAAGADSFLKKPFDSQELLQRVQDLIASRPAADAATVTAPATPPPLPPFDTELGGALPPLDLGSFDAAPAFETSAGFAPPPAFAPAP